MNELLLRGAIALSNSRRRVTDVWDDRKEQGDIVQTIIIIAMFVLVCVVVGKILYTAITGQANKVSNCITNVNNGTCTNYK